MKRVISTPHFFTCSVSLPPLFHKFRRSGFSQSVKRKFSALCCACCDLICYSVLWYAMLCYSMRCHAMLCYSMPCHAMPFHAKLCYTRYYSIPCHILLCAVLRSSTGKTKQPLPTWRFETTFTTSVLSQIITRREVLITSYPDTKPPTTWPPRRSIRQI